MGRYTSKSCQACGWLHHVIASVHPINTAVSLQFICHGQGIPGHLRQWRRNFLLLLQYRWWPHWARGVSKIGAAAITWAMLYFRKQAITYMYFFIARKRIGKISFNKLPEEGSHHGTSLHSNTRCASDETDLCAPTGEAVWDQAAEDYDCQHGGENTSKTVAFCRHTHMYLQAKGRSGSQPETDYNWPPGKKHNWEDIDSTHIAPVSYRVRM